MTVSDVGRPGLAYLFRAVFHIRRKRPLWVESGHLSCPFGRVRLPENGGKMGDLNLRNVTLMALIISCFTQIGAQLFAISVVVSTITDAPPRSFAILEGDYHYDSSAFWSTVPPITGVLFIIAIFANWKTPRRALLSVSFALFVMAGLIAGVLLEPEFASITANGYSDKIDAALQSRAATWIAYDWAVWSISLASGIALLLALARPIPSDQAWHLN